MDTQTLTKEQKLAILSKDFLDRDGESFVKARTEGRLNWEDSIEGGAYSEYVLHPKSNEDLISNAYKIASDMITVMDTPFRVEIDITGDSSATNSKKVLVSTKVFDSPVLSIGKKLDTFIGLTVHEGCHLLYTDFTPTNGSPLFKTLHNIIEDERIERECGDSKPGLSNFLKAAKYYMFDLYEQEVRKKGGFDNLGRFPRLLNSILSMIRYPKAAEQADVEEFADVLLATREVLSPYPETTSEVNEAATKIEQIIKDFLNENPQNKSSQASGGSGQQDKSDEGQNSDTQQNKSSEESSQSDSNTESGSGQEDKDGSGSDGEIDAGMSQMESALNNIATEQKSKLSEEDMSNTIKVDGGRVGRVCCGYLERGFSKNSYIEKGKPNERIYNESLERVKPYISAIKRVLQLSSTEYKFSLRGMRSGRLDEGKLAEAFQGVPTVYLRKGEVRTDKVSVCMLIDESGSMWGSGEQAARDTAILLNEALTKISNVDLYIYGHTATRKNTELYVYREKGFKSKYALGGTDSRYGNKDSIAIREVAHRVRKFTKDKVLFFMISDGAPNESTTLVRDAVREIEKDGFSVVAISIDPYYDPSTMYSKNITLSNLNSLAKEVGKLVKKAVMENTKKQVRI